jgi:pimeloyl-ACP methyl ester carboxylesterase
MYQSIDASKRWLLKLPSRTFLVRAALALSIVGALVMASASTASATPVEGPEGAAFYTAPEELPTTKNGQLIQYRATTVNLNVTLPSYKAWKVMYQSETQKEKPVAVTGTVIEPTAKWTGKGTRPVVTVGIGTQGLGQQCAASKQMEAGTEYDGTAVIGALKAGYAVAITDYQGYTEGSVPAYSDGKSEGTDVLDIARAAREVPESGITEGNPVVAWGYSIGGQAVSWAGELQPSYAPDVKLIGVATGGTPADLQALAAFGNGSVASGFAFDGLIGLNIAYPAVSGAPEFGLFNFITLTGLKNGMKAQEECAIKTLSEFHDKTFEEDSKEGKTVEQVEAEHPAVKQILEEQKLGTKPITVPVYHYHGLEDQFVPVAADAELHYNWCKLGVKDDFQLYPGDHLLTDPTAVPTVVKWIEERVAGKTAPSTCGQHEPGAKLPSSARLTPETGDLIIPLPAWSLTGTVKEKKSGISIEVPKGATLTAEGDLTNQVLTASLSIPPINQTITVLGIPAKVKGSLTPTGPITGSVNLSEEGVLSQSAVGEANMKVGSIGIGFITVPVGCTTAEPIALPLSISEPVNKLASGNFGISSEVTVPPFSGCGIFGPVLSSLMSGPGNTISITAAPPAPINF